NLEFTANKRMSNRWSVNASYAYRWNRDNANGYFGQTLRVRQDVANPNDAINTEDGRYVFGLWSAKINGTIDARWGLRLTPAIRVSVSRTRRSTPQRAVAPRRFSTTRVVATAAAIAALLLGGVAAFRSLRASGPAPPALADLGSLAPEIADIVGQARAGVAQDPRDGTRWGRFGMVCEANGLAGAARGAYAQAAA